MEPPSKRPTIIDKNIETCCNLAKVKCTVSNNSHGDQVFIEASHIAKAIQAQFIGHTVSCDHELEVAHESFGKIIITVNKMKAIDPLKKGFFEFGKITDKTLFKFQGSSNLVIVDAETTTEKETLVFRVDAIKPKSTTVINTATWNYTSDWKNGSNPVPILIVERNVVEIVKQTWRGCLVYPGLSHSFTFAGWKCKVTLSGIRNVKPVPRNLNNAQGICLSEKHNIVLLPASNVILTCPQEEAIVANRLLFEIVEVDILPGTEANPIHWISRDRIIQKIREYKYFLVVGSKFVVKIDNLNFLIKTDRAFGPNKNQHKQLWKMFPTTTIDVYMGVNVRLILVDTDEIYPLQTLYLDVDMQKTKEIQQSKEIIEYPVLTKTFWDALPFDHVIYGKQPIWGKTSKGLSISFTPTKYVTGKSCERTCVYRVTNSTKLVLNASEQSLVTMTYPLKPYQKVDVRAKLLEEKVGGVPDEMINLIEECNICHNTEYGAHMKNLNIAPPRGILLSGPPGTGKTALAKVIGNVLGIENIFMYSGSEVWKKYVGESEQTVRNWFKPAQEAQKIYGAMSPKFLMIIDEGDSFLLHRKNSDRSWLKATVNAFLSALDGLSSNNSERLDNLLVIVITNDPEGIDEAAKRPGRLETHIHMGIPDFKGRKEIVEIHTREIKEIGQLHEDVDFDELAQLFEGSSGAVIESVIKRTIRNHARFCANQRLDISREKISRQLFIDTFHQSKNDDNVGKEYKQMFM